MFPTSYTDISHFHVGQMPESGHGMDGRLASLVVKQHGSPF
jgi:hypothetical protein